VKCKKFPDISYDFPSFLGGKHLLTDPQIITSGELGHIFSDGNLEATYIMFPKEHECNKFCKFFKLPVLSELDSDENHSSKSDESSDGGGSGPSVKQASIQKAGTDRYRTQGSKFMDCSP